MYGPHINEELIAKAILVFSPIKGKRNQVFIVTKFGFFSESIDVNARGVYGSPAYIRRAVEASLKRLDVQTIDLYYQHRTTPRCLWKIQSRRLLI